MDHKFSLHIHNSAVINLTKITMGLYSQASSAHMNERRQNVVYTSAHVHARLCCERDDGGRYKHAGESSRGQLLF